MYEPKIDEDVIDSICKDIKDGITEEYQDDFPYMEIITSYQYDRKDQIIQVNIFVYPNGDENRIKGKLTLHIENEYEDISDFNDSIRKSEIDCLDDISINLKAE